MIVVPWRFILKQLQIFKLWLMNVIKLRHIDTVLAENFKTVAIFHENEDYCHKNVTRGIPNNDLARQEEKVYNNEWLTVFSLLFHFI